MAGVQGSVERAARRELRRLGVSVTEDAAAALAVSLARQIDVSRGAVAAAAAAGQLRLILGDIRAEAAKASPEMDGIDEISARRARSAG